MAGIKFNEDNVFLKSEEVADEQYLQIIFEDIAPTTAVTITTEDESYNNLKVDYVGIYDDTSVIIRYNVENINTGACYYRTLTASLTSGGTTYSTSCAIWMQGTNYAINFTPKADNYKYNVATRGVNNTGFDSISVNSPFFTFTATVFRIKNEGKYCPLDIKTDNFVTLEEIPNTALKGYYVLINDNNTGQTRRGSINISDNFGNGITYRIVQDSNEKKLVTGKDKEIVLNSNEEIRDYNPIIPFGDLYGNLSISTDAEWITNLTLSRKSISYNYDDDMGIKNFNFSLEALKNTTGKERVGNITVTCTYTNGSDSKSVIIPVRQGAVSINFDAPSLQYPAAATSGENILNTTGVTTDPSFVSDSDWLTVGGYDEGDGSFVFSMTKNETGRYRTGTITATVEQDGQTYTDSFTVLQKDYYGDVMAWKENRIEFDGIGETRHGTLIFHGSLMPDIDKMVFALPSWITVGNCRLTGNDYTVDVPLTASRNTGDTRTNTVEAQYEGLKAELPVSQPQADLRYLEWRESPMDFDFNRHSDTNELTYDGWTDVPLNTQFTTDNEWIHLGYFDYSSHNLPFSIDMNEAETARTGTVKASYTDTDGKSFEDTFIINQSAFVMEYIPVWKDATVQYDVANSDAYIDYKLYADNVLIYEGRAFPRPNEKTVSICPNRIAENYLQQNVDFDNFERVQVNADVIKAIMLETSAGDIYKYYAVYDWSYNLGATTFDGDRSDPVRRTIDSRMYAPQTVISNGVCRTRWDAVTYNKKSMCGDYYGVYYVNDKGGWDAFLFRGKNIRTDNLTRSNVERSVSNLTHQHRNSVYMSEVSTKWNLYTDYLTNDECSRMYQIFESPMVYLHDLKTDEIVPVNVSSSSVEYKDTIWNRKRYYNVEFTRSRTLYRK